MEDGASDLQIELLLDKTRALLAAAESGDTDAVGRQLAERQICLDEIHAAGGFGSVITPEQQVSVNEILCLDKEACGRIKQLRDDCARSVSAYSKKASGVLKYRTGSYELEHGQFFQSKSF